MLFFAIDVIVGVVTATTTRLSVICIVLNVEMIGTIRRVLVPNNVVLERCFFLFILGSNSRMPSWIFSEFFLSELVTLSTLVEGG